MFSAALASMGTLFGQGFVTGAAGFMDNGIAYGESSYFGTARSMALGNALTSVGGDQGSIPINPAGAAVAPYSQASVTAGASISSVSAAYAPAYGDAYGNGVRSNAAGFVLPSVGATMRLNMGSTGLKGMTFSILYGTERQYLSRIGASGSQSAPYMTSMCGAFAYAATADGLDPNLPYETRYNGAYDWGEVAAYGGNLIGYSERLARFIPSTQNEDGETVSGTKLDQAYSRNSSGKKDDIIFNMAFQVGDNVYLGMTLGVPMVRYRDERSISEVSVGSPIPVTFEGEETTSFKRADYSSVLSTRMTGVYGKFGIIWRAGDVFRFGAAIKTPTRFNVSEAYTLRAASSYNNGKYFSDSPSYPDEFNYVFTSPFEFNVGASMVLGKAGLVSVDYELMDYHAMRYSAGSAGYFDATNNTIRNFCGVSHMLRVGAELRLNTYVSARVGYNLLTNPEKYYDLGGGEKIYASDWDGTPLSGGSARYVPGLVKHTVSAGLGYSSPGSFFADLAVRATFDPTRNFGLYIDYDRAVSSPDVRFRRTLWDVVATIGWRF